MRDASILSWSSDGLKCGESLITASHSPPAGVGELGNLIAGDQPEYGVLLTARAENASCWWRCCLGVNTDQVLRWSACHRYEPFWMLRTTGTSFTDVPPETQYLLVELTGDRYILIVPLVDNHFHVSLSGTENGNLFVIVESGDTSVVSTEVDAVYMLADSDPFKLMRDASEIVSHIVPNCSLRRRKPLPEFIDWFGWCTWDAFYQDVSHEKVINGLLSFKAADLLPRFLILDDGWQQVLADGNRTVRLSSFTANEKFGHDLTPMVSQARDLGIQSIIVWHALSGYWAGVNPLSFAEYEVRIKNRSFSAGILHHMPKFNSEYWGSTIGVVPASRISQFYDDYYHALAIQGVDGVKVDNQCAIEAVGEGEGGRVALMHAYHQAIEGAAQRYFNGNIINCMSCASEVFYQSSGSTLIRTSTDFWPNRPETHGLHLITNAHVSLWFSNFMHPDWDMFQSGHEAGPYHAAARAISGAPVYVSDKPDGHDFELLRKLVLRDGTVLRCRQPALPAKESLFNNPLTDPVPLKIFNYNAHGGVLGVFHALHRPEAPITIHCTASPADIPDLHGDLFVTYAFQTKEVLVLTPRGCKTIDIEPGSYELITVVPVTNGVAPIGLLEMFNSAGAITAVQHNQSGEMRVDVRGEGPFGIWAADKPQRVSSNNGELEWKYDDRTRLVTLQLDSAIKWITVVGV